MRHSVGLYQSMDMLQPARGVRHLLLLAAVQNQNQAVHIQRDVTLDHRRTGVEAKDRQARGEEKNLVVPSYSVV